ncbi:hypothetical protein GCM10027446_20350 [Angustibacter peucedani]
MATTSVDATAVGVAVDVPDDAAELVGEVADGVSDVVERGGWPAAGRASSEQAVSARPEATRAAAAAVRRWTRMPQRATARRRRLG